MPCIALARVHRDNELGLAWGQAGMTAYIQLYQEIVAEHMLGLLSNQVEARLRSQ